MFLRFSPLPDSTIRIPMKTLLTKRARDSKGEREKAKGTNERTNEAGASPSFFASSRVFLRAILASRDSHLCEFTFTWHRVCTEGSGYDDNLRTRIEKNVTQ